MNGQIIGIGVSILLWGALVFLTAIKIRHTSMSAYEIRRRIAAGDSHALYAQRRELVAPRLEFVQWFLQYLLIIAMTLTMVSLYGWIYSGIGMLGAIAGTRLAVRLRNVQATAHRMYTRYESQCITIVESRKWLDYFCLPPAQTKTPIRSKEELLDLIASLESIPRHDIRRIEKAALFDKKTVQDVMTDRADIVTIASDDPLGPVVLDDLHSTGHRRFPVIKNDIDHVVGIVDSKEVIDSRSKSLTVNEAMNHHVMTVAPDVLLSRVLEQFIEEGISMAIVSTADHKTVGLVTLSDVIGFLRPKK